MDSNSDKFLEIKGLRKSFGGLTVLMNFECFVSRDEILGIIGPNGAGKTTIFNLITGFYQPDEGDIIYKNKSIRNLKPHQICKAGIARTFQLVKPFIELSVLENVRIGSYNKKNSFKEANDNALKIIDFFGLWAKRDYLMSSLNIVERKKIEFARALATEPDLILLDEVMAGLNAKEIKDFIALIKEVNKGGKTLVCIEHVMSGIMEISDRIVVINGGKK